MTSPAPAERLAFLFEWAQHDRRRRLGLWLLVAIALHAGAYFLFRIEYPRAEPARLNEGALYLLLPGSPDRPRLNAFLDSTDPSLFAPERTSLVTPPPTIPAYEPSYLATRPPLEPLTESRGRVLPPLPVDLGPVPVAEPAFARPALPPPASDTRLQTSANLRARLPANLPAMRFTARPGDQLPPARFLIALAPDGRPLHVVRDGVGVNATLDDQAARYLMALRFTRGHATTIDWGTVTFHWGLDVTRKEPDDRPPEP